MAPRQDAPPVVFSKPSSEELKKIIQTKDGTIMLVKWANTVGSSLAGSLSTNQIRAIFSEVRQIEGKWKIREQEDLAKRQLILLKPKMAYRAKKEETSTNKSVKNLVSVLDEAIDLVQSDKENFTRFVDFFEAILAYHRAAGGK